LFVRGTPPKGNKRGPRWGRVDDATPEGGTRLVAFPSSSQDMLLITSGPNEKKEIGRTRSPAGDGYSDFRWEKLTKKTAN